MEEEDELFWDQHSNSSEEEFEGDVDLINEILDEIESKYSFFNYVEDDLVEFILSHEYDLDLLVKYIENGQFGPFTIRQYDYSQYEEDGDTQFDDDGQDNSETTEFKNKIAENSIQISIIGPYKSGKTKLINKIATEDKSGNFTLDLRKKSFVFHDKFIENSSYIVMMDATDTTNEYFDIMSIYFEKLQKNDKIIIVFNKFDLSLQRTKSRTTKNMLK
ncbi:hypothetical protein TVAG_300020 [Trichomonas vaginalis G3]|uniref:Uncharacterized protein n=1 Tax=Trichomonas vaginalis (strain ATCC PRA-98 / G3) TaxID=412133 RepID=A2FAF5_TRIV3|nr:P-loop containing nucleoside triphosphate hydrolases family [Trichomonas vaginalis G3]EAX98127.1 hypothetical protein TVAG_300020 [Trichomonas vaginalis G3]KAI5531610.1 P-loop containing nucleoside triphosphate hydrolases family [Trichomonas vaginalis G3]|eukprot:XP_001311057.1 hypothetical protein [Trichomonas vaginalis G3]